MTTPSRSTSRRRFLQSAGAVAAATSIPGYFVSTASAQDAKLDNLAPSEGVRIGLIGCGSQGVGDAKNASKFGKIVAVADVDEARLEKAKQTFAGSEGYGDFRKLLDRKDIDAVICGTVDHWHALVSVAAMKAGKDVYCEKPLTLTIDEGKWLVKAQKLTKRVLQTGTQQRSSARFQLAVDSVRNGRIGKVETVEVWLPAGLRQGPFKFSPVPKGFNYDYWMGPTPDREYVKERTHFSFRYWWEYSGGTMTDWGAHHNDIVLWALGMDGSGPVAIDGHPTVDMIPGGYTAASEYEVAYTYANGVKHYCRSTTASEWNGSTKDPKGQLHGIKFIGTDGWIWVTRDKIEASERERISQEFPSDAVRVFASKDHMQNFIDCVKSRKDPICTAEIGHRSASVGHLGVIAIKLGRKLHWNPEEEKFVNDKEANSYLAREMRKPYDYSFT